MALLMSLWSSGQSSSRTALLRKRHRSSCMPSASTVLYRLMRWRGRSRSRVRSPDHAMCSGSATVPCSGPVSSSRLEGRRRLYLARSNAAVELGSSCTRSIFLGALARGCTSRCALPVCWPRRLGVEAGGRFAGGGGLLQGGDEGCPQRGKGWSPRISGRPERRDAGHEEDQPLGAACPADGGIRDPRPARRLVHDGRPAPSPAMSVQPSTLWPVTTATLSGVVYPWARQMVPLGEWAPGGNRSSVSAVEGDAPVPCSVRGVPTGKAHGVEPSRERPPQHPPQPRRPAPTAPRAPSTTEQSRVPHTRPWV